VIAWSGVAYAAFGITVFAMDPTYVPWSDIRGFFYLTSTFGYRSTAAVYFGLCTVLWLLFVLQHLRRRLPLDSVYWRSGPRLLLAEMPILSFVMLLICLTAMLMTKSRAGVALSFMAFTIALVGFFYRGLQRRGRIAAALVIGALTTFFLFEILGGNVIQRLEFEGFVDPGRLETYRSTLRMIADHPWFGTGLGTFVWSFPVYRSGGSMWGVWEFAHSTPLELAADLGLPLAGLIGLAWLIVLVVLIRGVRIRRSARIVPAGALAVAILALLHSFVDFSLQIPGYAIVVFAVVGAGLAQSFSSDNVNKAHAIPEKSSAALQMA
jgi:O-antigen ligase